MKSLTEHPYFRYFCLAVVAIYVLFLQFYHLGELPIVQWDESRLAVNAAEMSQTNSFLISTFENKADLYNTKPPLLVWIQTLCIKVFGLSEWSVRLPSALAALACFFAVFNLVYSISKNIYYGLLASLLLATSDGFIQLHGSMTGDYDTLLSAFVLAALMYLRSYIIDQNDKALLGFTIFQSLALLCKSAAGIIPIPVYLIVVASFKDYGRVKPLLMALLISLMPFVSYIFIREMAEGGYLQAIWNNDFHGRFSKALEGHTSEWHYYIVNLFDYRFHYWIWLLPLVLVACPFIKDRNLRYFSLSFLLYIFFLSVASTRIHWYDMPLLPLVAILLSYGLFVLHSKIKRQALKSIFTICLLGALVIPLKDKFEFIAYRKGLLLDPGHYELSHMMKSHDRTQKAKYIANWYDAEFYFYTRQHSEISRGKFRQLSIGDTVMMGNLYKDSLPLRYNYKLIQTTGNAQTVVITGHKNP
ncbi:MAG: ArnT family glycosyltransferase [Chitinophagaceae bacterium]